MTITVGSYVEIASGLTSTSRVVIGTCALSSSLALVAFRYFTTGTDGKLYVAAVSISGTTVSVGTEQLIGDFAADKNTCGLAKLSATEAVICWREDTTTDDFWARHITVSGLAISLGSALQIESVASSTSVGVAMAEISSTKVFVVEHDKQTDSDLWGWIITHSGGGTLSAGATATLSSNNVSDSGDVVDAIALSSTRAVVMWLRASAFGGVLSLVDTSGATPSFLDTEAIGSARWDSSNVKTRLAKLSSTKFAVTYKPAAGDAKIVIVDATGDSLTIGTPLDLTSLSAGSVAHPLAERSATQVLMLPFDGTERILREISISGTTPSEGDDTSLDDLPGPTTVLEGSIVKVTTGNWLLAVTSTASPFEIYAAGLTGSEYTGGGDDGPCTNYAIFYYGIETPLVRGGAAVLRGQSRRPGRLCQRDCDRGG